jgi:predicted acetyltransferase
MKNDGTTVISTRSVREDELDAFLGLMCRAFSLDFAAARPIFYSDPFHDLSLKRVLVDGTTRRIISGLTIVPAAMRLPSGAIIPLAGIAGVCTQPEMQRRGHGRKLLESALADLPGLGFPLAALTAEAPALYERAGFESCSAPMCWQVANNRRLPAYSEGRDTRVLTYDQWTCEAKPVRALYDRAVGVMLGSIPRDSRRWANIESPGSRRSIAVWKNSGQPEAYLIFQEKPEDEGVTLSILEMVSQSEAGCRALIGFLARRQDVTLRGQLRGSDVARFGLDRITGMELRVEPGMLVRVTDMERVLTLAADNKQWSGILMASKSGLTIRVEESRLSWSQKSLRLFAATDQSGRVGCALAPSDELIGDWISLGSPALSQLVTGFKSARQLHSEERLRTSGVDALALTERLFPQSEPYLGPLDAF